jgi:hypothetical protein
LKPFNWKTAKSIDTRTFVVYLSEGRPINFEMDLLDGGFIWYLIKEDTVHNETKFIVLNHLQNIIHYLVE